MLLPLQTSCVIHVDISDRRKQKHTIITQDSVFTINIKLNLFIRFSLLYVSAVNYLPSSGNSYIHSTYSAILPYNRSSVIRRR
jgi:hypothetical protein